MIRLGTTFWEWDETGDDTFGRIDEPVQHEIDQWPNIDEVLTFTAPFMDGTADATVRVRVRGYRYTGVSQPKQFPDGIGSTTTPLALFGYGIFQLISKQPFPLLVSVDKATKGVKAMSGRTRIISLVSLSIILLVVSPLLHAKGANRPFSVNFNGDNYADLAVGVYGEDIGYIVDAGAVNILPGSNVGVWGSDDQPLWHQDSPGVASSSEAGDEFGSTLASADFNGDGYLDLAVGVPREDVGSITDAGAVNILYGSAGGLTASSEPIWHQDQAGIDGIALNYEYFGDALAAGDFNGDGVADLAIGVPRDNHPLVSGTGAVHVLYGSVTGLSADGSIYFNQGDLGGSNILDVGEEFGAALAAGDFDSDGFSDLAVGVPYDWVQDYGGVNVIYGSVDGLTAQDNQFWSQGSEGIHSDLENDDHFGAALASADFNWDGYTDLAVGVPDEDINAEGIIDCGAVNVLFGSPGGLTAQGNVIWHQNVTNVGDVAESHDHFGASLAAGDINGDDHAELAIGVPDEDVNNVDDGAVHILYGYPGGLIALNDEIWHQDIDGVVDQAEWLDSFGESLSIGDANNDGYGDLAIGVPGEAISSSAGGAQGGVHFIYGSTLGLSTSGDWLFHQNGEGIADSVEGGDNFGAAVVFSWWSNPLPNVKNLSASDGMYSDGIWLEWDALPGADYYYLYSSSEGGGLLGRAFDANYLDESVNPDEQTYYWVRGCNEFGCGPWGEREIGHRALETPTNVSASDGYYADRVNIVWQEVPGEPNYLVYRSTSPTSNNAPIGSTRIAFYRDFTAEPGVRYYYWVIACGLTCSIFGQPDIGYTSVRVYLPLAINDSE